MVDIAGGSAFRVHRKVQTVFFRVTCGRSLCEVGVRSRLS